MLRMLNLKLSIDRPETELSKLVAQTLKIEVNDILSLVIEKKSLDARPKIDGNIYFIYSVDILLEEDLETEILSRNLPNIRISKVLSYIPPKRLTTTLDARPIIVGAGPAGLAAGLLLAEAGYLPIIIEQGEQLEDRRVTVEKLGDHGFKEYSNMQFGEGGAAVFSAGLFRKFSKDERIKKLISDFKLSNKVHDSAFYEDHTFLGADVMYDVVLNIKKRIKEFGGEFLYKTKVENLLIVQGVIKGVITDKNKVFYSDHVIFATGISARNSYEILKNHNIDMSLLPFAVGLRIEHPKSVINRAQYREYAYHPNLKPAGYSLNYRTSTSRTVYPFAISPGGIVVPCPTEYGGLMVGGTTKSSMDSPNTNSALVVQINLSDLPSDDILAGIDFQRDLEQKTFAMGGRNFKAPAQLLGDFIKDQPSTSLGSVTPTYPAGVTLCNLRELIPNYVSTALIEAINSFGKKINGFAMDDAVLTGIESRPSSTIRITRCKVSLQSVSVSGLFVAGDGTGYASGIISSYVDGIKVAEAVIADYELNKGR